MSTPTFPPPPIELQDLGNGPDAFPPPPQPSPQTSTGPNPNASARRPNNLKGDRSRPKDPLQKYTSGSDSGSTRDSTPSPTPPSGAGHEVSAQGDSKPLPPLMDPRFTNLDNGIAPAPAPEPANTNQKPKANPNLNLNATVVQPGPPQKRDLAIQESGTVVELLDRPYLTPDDDAVLMRPQVGDWDGAEGGRKGRNGAGRHHRKDQLDSIGLPGGFRAPPRYGDPAAARRYSSSSSDTMHSSSSSGCHGQSNCVLCAPFFALLLI